ncbi:MAG TPA: LamG domain-containing protein, partial [Thermoanaerobaculia bacterium]
MPNPPDCEVSTFFISLPTSVSYAQIPAISGSFSSAFTVALWVDIEALAPGQNSLVTVTAGGQSYNLLAVYGSYYGGPTLIASWGNGSVNTDFTMDTWTYLVVTWDGTNLTLYVDGDEIGSVQPTTTSSVTNPAFTLGANATMPPRSGSAGLFGGVRNFAYWSQVLTAAQIPTQMWTNSATVSTNL